MVPKEMNCGTQRDYCREISPLRELLNMNAE
jgi:hypothetical protein